MSWWSKLRPHQVELLRRIGGDARPVTSREPALAATVYALRSRRLVTTPRSGGVWTAVITDSGRYYLEHGDYIGAGHSSGTAPARSQLPARPLQRRGAPPVESAEPAGQTEVPRPAELIAQLQEHNMVRVPDPAPTIRAAWRRVIHALKDQGPVPDAYRLQHHGRDRGDLVVQLVAGAHPSDQYRKERPAIVPLPAATDEDAPFLQELRRHPDRVRVSDDSLPRALRLIQALAAEAERRGHGFALTDDGSPGFVIQVNDRGYLLLMTEEYDTVDMPDVEHLDDAKVYPWQRVQMRPEAVPSGRLVLELAGDAYRYRGRQRRWADRQRWRLEDKLGEVLAAVETRAEIDAQAQQAAEQAAAERHRRWEQAMDRARDWFAEDHRVKALDDQLNRWLRARQIREYAAALQAGGQDRKTQEGEASDAAGYDKVAGWISWMLAYADSVDPLLHAPEVPVPREPRPEDLRRYLNGWSPYGPESTH